MFVDESSVCTVSVFHADAKPVCMAHLFGFVLVPQVGIVAGKSHLYQISVIAGVQNFVDAALFVSVQMPPSSPSVSFELLSTPVNHYEAGIKVSSNLTTSV